MNTDSVKVILLAVKQVRDYARLINPEVDYVSCCSIDNTAYITAYAGDEQVISAHMFDDGTFRIGNNYFNADGTFDFAFEGTEKAC